MSNLQSIRSQKMAQEAYPLVDKLKDHELESKYRTLALTFPTMILQSGLSQAVGFLLAKGKDEHSQLLEHLAKLLGFANGETLHKEILAVELSEYQLLTRRALDASSWLKRYTEALLKKEGK